MEWCFTSPKPCRIHVTQAQEMRENCYKNSIKDIENVVEHVFSDVPQRTLETIFLL